MSRDPLPFPELLEPLDRGRFKRKRVEMVEYLRERGIRDPGVLWAMKGLPRHLFLEEGLWDMAYEDVPLPIGEGQTTSSPSTIASMLEILRLERGMKVLEVGTGCGYQTALLSLLGCSVFSLEKRESLLKRAGEVLKSLELPNALWRAGDGRDGWMEFSPYHRIIYSVAFSSVTSRVWEQLEEGGILLVPLIKVGGEQELVLMEKKGGARITLSCGRAGFLEPL